MLGELNNIQSINEVFEPIDSQLINNYTDRVDSKLPIEYLNLIKQSEGIDFGDYRILGASEIYSTGLDDGNYYHLVEFDDGVIAIKERERSGTIYFCHYSGPLDNLGTDFRKVMLDCAKSTTPQHDV